MMVSATKELEKKSWRRLQASLLVIGISCLFSSVGADDPVYVRSGDFGQLVTSSTSRWIKGLAKDPLTLVRPNHGAGVICRVYHTTLRGVGLVTDEAEGSICNINTQEGAQGSDKFQTISTTASRFVWTPWKRPNPPPTGAVAISTKPQLFLAADVNSSAVGYLDPTLSLGSASFPDQPEAAKAALVLTEVEPTRYELSDVQLKRNKGFIEEDIILAYGKLVYAEEDDDQDIPGEMKERRKKGRIESILSYETNSYDYWGQGYLMSRGLHTTIHLPTGATKVIEWGMPLTQAGKTETMTAVADLLPGTGINVTLHGTRLNGEMQYWATLKTFFKDGSSSTRLTDNHRKVIEIQDIRLEHSKPYFLENNTLVPEPTTTTTTTPNSNIRSSPTSTSSPEDDEDVDYDRTEGGNALPVEISPHNIQADQSELLSNNKMDDLKSQQATTWALSHTSTSSVPFWGALVSISFLLFLIQ